MFTEDEEKGCVGAEKFAVSDYIVNNDINYIIEIDRRGTNDCVFYSCDNQEFEKFIESTGYFKTAWGSVSDISTIAPALGVAAVNLSSGYFDEHTTRETINVEALLSTIEEAKKRFLLYHARNHLSTLKLPMVVMETGGELMMKKHHLLALITQQLIQMIVLIYSRKRRRQRNSSIFIFRLTAEMKSVVKSSQ